MNENQTNKTKNTENVSKNHQWNQKKKSKKTNKTQKRILMTDETDVNLSNKLPKTKYIKQKIITRLNKELKIKKFRN